MTAERMMTATRLERACAVAMGLCALPVLGVFGAFAFASEWVSPKEWRRRARIERRRLRREAARWMDAP